MQLSQVEAYTYANESKRNQTYDDATGETIGADGLGIHSHAPLRGTLTIGVGHTHKDLKPGEVWADAHVMLQYGDDYGTAMVAAAALCAGAWSKMGPIRQAAVTDMCFQMGRNGVSKFLTMLGDIKGAHWKLAAQDILISEYAKQTPTRARRNADMIETNSWPKDYP